MSLMNKKTNLTLASIFMLVTIISSQSYGALEITNSRLSGASVAAGNSIDVQDDKYTYMQTYPSWPTVFTNKKVTDRIIFSLDPAGTKMYTVAFACTLGLSITYYDAAFSPTTVTKTLIINYNPAGGSIFTDKDAYVLTGGHRVVVTITSLSGASGVTNLFLEAEVDVERYYSFIPSSVPTITSRTVYGGKKLEVYWGYFGGTEEYDLEWTFVNDYKDSLTFEPTTTLEYDFDRNSTRVSLTNNHYHIPLVYEHGYILYRVRQVGKFGSGFDKRQEGRWSDYTYIGNKVAGFPDRYYNSTAHEDDDFNWSYSASYMYCGNRSEVINYFDATILNRQLVTINNTADRSVVQEIIYDHQGRPGIFVLPAPTEDSTLHYYSNFNRNSSNVAYSKFDFDTLAAACQITTRSMHDSLIGASRYYSPKNPYQEGFQAYVPDAELYPFTRSEYTPDLTGRIRRQSGIGPDHLLDSGHEVKYYYGKPGQKKLDRLFGTDAGYAAHYQKNMKSDQNGQLKVSYADQSGRVVATALAGSAPSSLIALNSNTGSNRDTINLLENNVMSVGESGEILATRTFLVTSTGIHKFDYGITPKYYKDTCLLANICYDCIYDLEVSIQDECGLEMIPGGPYKKTIGQLPLDTICQDTTYRLIISSDSFFINLTVGSYSMVKTLTVNEDALNYYTVKYLEQDTCLPTYHEFLQTFIDSIDFSGCNADFCDLECVEKLGTKEVYGGSDAEYDSLFAICKRGCKIVDFKDGMYNMLLADVSPGGQYGFFWADSIDPSQFNLSVYNTSNKLPDRPNADWRNPASVYKDLDNNPDSIYLVNGMKVPPDHDSVSIEIFMSNWKSSWAKSLVTFHPEYCYYDWTISNESAHEYEYRMIQTYYYLNALDSGYMNPINMTHAEGVPDSVPANTSNKDPFFDTGGLGVSYLGEIKDSLRYFKIFGTDTFTMWEWATIATHCPADSTVSQYNTCISNHEFGQDSCKRDYLWQTFKAFYLAERQEIADSIRTAYAIINKCYNGCIGENPVTWDSTLHDFDCFTVNQIPYCPSTTDYDADQDTIQPCSYLTKTYYANKTKRFPTSLNVLGIDTAGGVIDYIDSLAKVIITNFCDSNCNDYASAWMSTLSPCAMSAVDSSAVRAELIELCKLGCDSANSFGSSTLPSGVTTANGNSTFEAVLAYHLGPKTHKCNGLLLSWPKAYGHNYNGAGSYMDTCACELILINDSVYTNIATLPDWVVTQEDLFIYTYNERILNLSDKACICKDAFAKGGSSWSPGAAWPTAAETYLQDTAKVYINPSINCFDCISCHTFYLQQDTFDLAYPEAIDSSNYLVMLTNYINKKLNLNLYPSEYQSFWDDCDILGMDNLPVCGPLTDEALDLEKLLNMLAEKGYLANSVNDSIDLNLYSIYKDGSLPAYTTPHHKYWTCYDSPINDDCNDSVIVAHIGSAADLNNDCEITLEIKNDPYLNFDNIISLDRMEVDSPGCSTDYDFIMQATFVLSDGSWHTDTLWGTASCYPIAECQCTKTGFEICNHSMFFGIEADTNDCRENLILRAKHNAWNAYNEYLDSVRNVFRVSYINKCMKAMGNETFTMSFDDYEYHYTLFYYNQAGNLVKTVPPKGVNMLAPNQVSNVRAQRDNPTGVPVVPSHTMVSLYRYNSLNEIIEASSPDGGKIQYWYDEAGRIAVSQNAVEAVDFDYSFSIYDSLNRIEEVGAIHNLIAMTDQKARNKTDLETWINGGTKTELTRTFYDKPLDTYVENLFPNKQQNLRLRVSSSATYKYDVADGQYDHAKHFSYDSHGYTADYIQEMPALKTVSNDVKLMHYDYELVSGNVLREHYQQGKADEFIHKYCYNPDNKLWEAYTSRDSVLWDKDGKYYYYHHYRFARLELGDHKVHGLDHAFTIHGWIKGVNSNTLNKDRDIGKDGATGSAYISTETDIHLKIARDAFGFTLGYFTDDFSAISQPSPSLNFEADVAGSGFETSSPELFNSNIRHMVTAIEGFSIQGTAYKYDQLNRIKRMKVYQNVNTTTNVWPAGGGLNDYMSKYWYDSNGNLDSLIRNGFGGTLAMDTFKYHYNAGNNQLNHVTEPVGIAGNYTVDIDNQLPSNYLYDQTGNLIKDASEQIDNISWNVYGKVNTITTSALSGKPDIDYEYDAFNRRIVKTVDHKNDNYVSTYYVRGPSGNVLATYERDSTSLLLGRFHIKFTLLESHVYGTERLGVNQVNKLLREIDTSIPINFTATKDPPERKLGRKKYALKNHLGNVLAVISDRKMPQDNPMNGLIDYYLADICSKTDYYAFGMLMPGRQMNPTIYRYGFQEIEKDNEISGNGNSYSFQYRGYDSRLGRFKSVDPLKRFYPSNSPYNFSENRVIDGIDLEGSEWKDIHIYVNEKTGERKIIKEESYRGKTEKEMNELHGKKNFFRKYSDSFGKKGRGFRYIYYIHDEDGNFHIEEEWMQKPGLKRGGIFMGKGAATMLGPRFDHDKELNPFRFKEAPIHSPDLYGRTHDIAEAKPGFTSWKQRRWLPADKELARDMRKFYRASLKRYKNRPIDPVTGRKISREARFDALKGAALFTIVVPLKIIFSRKEKPVGLPRAEGKAPPEEKAPNENDKDRVTIILEPGPFKFPDESPSDEPQEVNE
ncbi:MAG: hypothetical protein IIA45_09760 [Bacteroidetes bacterium]|nr:hypothetical protein [Bacteroidota bacterium]